MFSTINGTTLLDIGHGTELEYKHTLFIEITKTVKLIKNLHISIISQHSLLQRFFINKIIFAITLIKKYITHTSNTTMLEIIKKPV